MENYWTAALQNFQFFVTVLHSTILSHLMDLYVVPGDRADYSRLQRCRTFCPWIAYVLPALPQGEKDQNCAVTIACGEAL